MTMSQNIMEFMQRTSEEAAGGGGKGKGGKGGGGGGAEGKNNWKILDERHFRRWEKFAGDEEKWNEWRWQMKSAMRGACKKAGDLMNWAEEMKEEEDLVNEEEWDLKWG